MALRDGDAPARAEGLGRDFQAGGGLVALVFVDFDQAHHPPDIRLGDTASQSQQQTDPQTRERSQYGAKASENPGLKIIGNQAY